MLFVERRNILIAAAHADDHTRCAGTVKRAQIEHDMVPYEVVYTDSSRGQDYRTVEHAPTSVVKKMRNRELTRASSFLGIRDTFLFDEPDYELRDKPELIFATAQKVRDLKPAIVFLPNPEDYHTDHRYAYKIGMAAIEFAAMNTNTQVTGEPFRVPTILCMEMMSPILPDLLVDVTKYKRDIDELWNIYESQKSPRLERCLSGKQGDRAYLFENEQVTAAEGFVLQREFPNIL